MRTFAERGAGVTTNGSRIFSNRRRLALIRENWEMLRLAEVRAIPINPGMISWGGLLTASSFSRLSITGRHEKGAT